jgi:NADH-quinone oxidoreductase subunit C
VSAADRALAARIPDAQARTAFGQTTAHVPLDAWVDAARYAHDTLGCTQFDWLGVEDAGRPGAVGVRHAVLLHVLDPDSKDGVLLRTELGPDDALPSVAALWAGAAWHEREAVEMFGIALDREAAHLLLPDSFSGHPLRKDFVLASRVVRPWPGRLEPGEAGTSTPSRRRAAPPGVPDPSWGPRYEAADDRTEDTRG